MPDNDSLAQALAPVLVEIVSQREAFGDQHMGYSDLYWLGILMEEVGEVAKALVEGKIREQGQAEIAQVAAVAINWLRALELRR